MATRPEEGKAKEQKDSKQEQPQATGRALAPSRRGAVSSYGGFEPLYRLHEEFNRLFDQFLPGWPSPWEGSQRDGWGLDLQEDDSAVAVRAEAPGFEPSDFDIQVRGDQLVLRAAHK